MIGKAYKYNFHHLKFPYLGIKVASEGCGSVFRFNMELPSCCVVQCGRRSARTLIEVIWGYDLLLCIVSWLVQSLIRLDSRCGVHRRYGEASVTATVPRFVHCHSQVDTRIFVHGRWLVLGSIDVIPGYVLLRCLVFSQVYIPK